MSVLNGSRCCCSLPLANCRAGTTERIRPSHLRSTPCIVPMRGCLFRTYRGDFIQSIALRDGETDGGSRGLDCRIPEHVCNAFLGPRLPCAGMVRSTALLLTLAVMGTAARAQRDYATPYVFTTLAGSPGVIGSADGTGGAARFSEPNGLATDTSGNI